jgi:glyoxylate reductase
VLTGGQTAGFAIDYALRFMTDPLPIVLIARPLPQVGLERLGKSCEIREGSLTVRAEQLRELAAGSSAIISDPTVTIDATLLDAAGPQLKVVANFGVGYDNVDLAACQRRGVIATNTPGVLTNATAELALALTLAAARQIGKAEADLRAKRWDGFDSTAHLGLELSGAVFGVVGLGRIGSRYAELVAPLAAKILYTSRTQKTTEERRLGATFVELEELIAGADVISLHLPGGRDTDGLIGERELAGMKDDAILINTARGSLLEIAALVMALEENWIGAAGLDVYAAEPEVPTELLNAPNCVLLPHIGSATTRARNAMALLVAEDTLAVLAGAEPTHRICPQK